MPKIEEMFAYITHEPGDPDDEGLTAVRGSSGVWVPMVGADEERMMSLKLTAQGIANITRQKITLVKFSVRTELETIIPNRHPAPSASNQNE